MSWHWLRHDWGKWEQYQQGYSVSIMFGGVPTDRMMNRQRIRQKRVCATCGTMQDRVVTELHGD